VRQQLFGLSQTVGVGGNACNSYLFSAVKISQVAILRSLAFIFVEIGDMCNQLQSEDETAKAISTFDWQMSNSQGLKGYNMSLARLRLASEKRGYESWQ